MSGRQKTVQVYVDTAAARPMLLGTLYAQSDGSQETFSFEYDPEWLEGSKGRYDRSRAGRALSSSIPQQLRSISRLVARSMGARVNAAG